jgi:hypothetical protein
MDTLLRFNFWLSVIDKLFLAKDLFGEPIDLVGTIHQFFDLFVGCLGHHNLLLRLFATRVTVQILDYFFVRLTEAMSFGLFLVTGGPVGIGRIVLFTAG